MTDRLTYTIDELSDIVTVLDKALDAVGGSITRKNDLRQSGCSLYLKGGKATVNEWASIAHAAEPFFVSQLCHQLIDVLRGQE